MNSINNNPFRNSNINMENNNILNNTSPKMKKIDKFEQPIAKNFLNKIKEEIEKAGLGPYYTDHGVGLEYILKEFK